MQQRVRVKICGLTNLDDVQCAVRAGADAIGLVFYAPSARAVSLEQAKRLRAAVPAFVDVVTLFVNAAPEQVQTVIDQVQPDLLQFHGDESPDYCAGFNHRYLRAFRLGAPGLATAADVLKVCRTYAQASAWLFDSDSPGYGGSGTPADATLLRDLWAAPDNRPLILAGGLSAQTIAASVQALHPYAVDVSSGVESEPGVKSAEKIAAFMRALRQA